MEITAAGLSGIFTRFPFHPQPVNRPIGTKRYKCIKKMEYRKIFNVSFQFLTGTKQRKRVLYYRHKYNQREEIQVFFAYDYLKGRYPHDIYTAATIIIIISSSAYRFIRIATSASLRSKVRSLLPMKGL